MSNIRNTSVKFNVCRICLTKSSKLMSSLEEKRDLVAMLSSLGNFEVAVNNFIPSYLCQTCEVKLQSAYDFQQLIKKSNQFIHEFILKSLKGEGSVDINYSKTEECNTEEEFDFQCINDEDQLDKADLKFEISEDAFPGQTMRLSQFPPDEVARAILKTKEYVSNNRKCFVCGFITCNSRALSAHMTQLHKEIKKRWCNLCNCEIGINLKEHQRECHADMQLECEFCGKILTNRGHLTEHLRSHSVVRPFKCNICKKSFISSRHLQNHFKIHSNKSYNCPHCTKKYSQLHSLKNHLKTNKTFACINCQVCFEDKSSERAHKCSKLSDTDNNVPQNFCKECNKKVRSLRVHLKNIHHDGACSSGGPDQVLCNICGKQFKTITKLRVHMRIHTGEAPYKCNYCDKRMATRNQLVIHERIHTGEKPHVCSVCGKAFAQSSVLNTHMKIHTGRPEKCQICNKRFCRPAELRLHIRKHTGEKPFLCVHCGRSFRQKSHMMEHTKTHSDERPFQCPHCEKAFKQRSILKSHVQIHLGFKPFKCSQCNYACRQSYSLTQHMKMHSEDAPREDRPYICQICQRGFTTVAMLTSHSSFAHNFHFS